jgi:hypothetical protein
MGWWTNCVEQVTVNVIHYHQHPIGQHRLWFITVGPSYLVPSLYLANIGIVLWLAEGTQHLLCLEFCEQLPTEYFVV